MLFPNVSSTLALNAHILDLMRRLGHENVTDEEMDAMMPWSPLMQETVLHIQIPEANVS